MFRKSDLIAVKREIKSDLFKWPLADHCSVVRSSGTEPELKTYISVSALDHTFAATLEEKITGKLGAFFRLEKI